MRRVQWQSIAVLAVLLLALTPSAFAQTSESEKNEAMAKDALASNFFPYRLPGRDPVVLYSELKCAFPELSKSKILTGDLISEIWDGKHDNCSAKRLLPISERLWRRAARALEISDKDTQTRREIGELLESGNYMARDFTSGSREATAKMSFGSAEPGKLTDNPFEPIGFTLHTIVLQPVTLHSGTHSTEARSLAFTTFFSFDDGHDAAPCLNPFAMYAQKEEVVAPPVTQTAAAAPLPPPPPTLKIPTNLPAPEQHQEQTVNVHSGCGKVCWIAIAGAIAAAGIACAIKCHSNVNVYNNTGTPSLPPTTIKPDPPLPTRPASVAFSVSF